MKTFPTHCLAIFIFLINLVLSNCGTKKQYTQLATITPEDTEQDIVYKAAHVVPSQRQLEWQEMEYIAFACIGVNTFTNREWGTGDEDPSIFNPTQLDALQWANVCKKAGMKLILLTTKHHDGFCLWPSKYTEHSVKNSPWKNGKGDVVKELADACRQTGLKLGLYLSPWDMHEPTYGDSPKYNEYFKNQLRELLTNYGEVAQVWFDGACGEGPNGKRQVYDWEGYYKVIRELQPNAVIAIMGQDVRWVGNEKGYARLSEWSVLPLTAQDQTIIAEHSQKIDGFVPKDKRDKDLGSREKIFQAEHLVWYPAEADVSIRPGWYYHPEQDDQVKSIRDLLDIYYASVGRNSVLLLNLPPDKRGLIHENDAKRVFELCKVLDATFDQNLALNVNVKANHVRQNNSEFYPENIVDDNKDTYWSTDDWTTTAEIVFDLGQNRTFNRAMLQEYIKVGQRVEEFVLQAWSDEQWKTFAKGTTVGYKRLLRFEDMTTRKVRLLINQSRVCPTLSNFGLYYQPPLDEILGS